MLSQKKGESFIFLFISVGKWNIYVAGETVDDGWFLDGLRDLFFGEDGKEKNISFWFEMYGTPV